MPIKTILFDINETVLDLSALTPIFKKYLKETVSVDSWFLTLLHTSTIAALTEIETTFAELAKNALIKLAPSANPSMQDTENTQNAIIEAVLSTLASLKPHSDIIPALTKLRENQVKTIAFSNSSEKLINSQIANAGLGPYFDKIISVEGAKSFKPDKKVYLHAAKTLNQPIEKICLIAAHDWDTHGAINAGMAAAYLDRSAKPYHPLYHKPNFTAPTMTEIAEKIIAEH